MPTKSNSPLPLAFLLAMAAEASAAVSVDDGVRALQPGSLGPLAGVAGRPGVLSDGDRGILDRTIVDRTILDRTGRPVAQFFPNFPNFLNFPNFPNINCLAGTFRNC